MYSVLKSYGLNGLNGFAVAVEADVSGGLPAFSLVGLPDSAVRESGDRVRSAVKNLGYKWPDRHITVNLAPADIRKSGPVYDLPLLLAVLTYGVYVVRYLCNDSIRTEEDMEKYFGLMPLAVIPEESANRDEDGMKPDGKRSQAKERRKK